jgi:hypothetical protein
MYIYSLRVGYIDTDRRRSQSNSCDPRDSSSDRARQITVGLCPGKLASTGAQITPNHTLWRVGTGKVGPDHTFRPAKSHSGPLESHNESRSLAGGNFDFA